jgi:hypothetical protein
MAGCDRREDKELGVRCEAPRLCAGAESDISLARCLAPRCDVAERGCQAALFASMACLYGVNANSSAPPPVRFVSRDELRAVSRELETAASAAAPWTNQAARRLGLAPEPKGVSSHIHATGANALYAPALREVLFVQNEAVPTNGELAWLVLGHEFVHALQDRDGALLTVLRSRSERSYDRDLALWSSIEGEAALYEEIMRGLLHGLAPSQWVPPRFEARTASTDASVEGQTRVLESSFGTFPYTYGASFATRSWLKRGTFLRDEPTLPNFSTRQIMASRHGWRDTADDGCGPSITNDRGRAGTSFPADALGAWIVQAYVQRRTRDFDRARRAARDFRGDALVAHRGSGGELRESIWRTCWSSGEVAGELSHIFSAQLGAAAVRVEGSTVVATLEGRPD